MKNVWFSSLVFGGIVLIVGCSKIPVIQSTWKNDNSSELVRYFEDSKNQIKWAVLNDNENLYVQIKTTNPKVVQMIMNDGLTLYVDTLAKKHKGCFLLVRNKQEGMIGMKPMLNRRQEMNSRISRNFDEAYWEQGGEKRFMDLQFEKTDYLATYGSDRSGEFSCSLVLPVKFFNYKRQLQEHRPVSLGLILKSEGIKLPMGKNPEGGEMRGRAEGGEMLGGGMGGGMPGGGGGMPGGGMGGRGMHRGGMPTDSSSSSNSLEIWIGAFLSEGNK